MQTSKLVHRPTSISCFQACWFWNTLFFYCIEKAFSHKLRISNLASQFCFFCHWPLRKVVKNGGVFSCWCEFAKCTSVSTKDCAKNQHFSDRASVFDQTLTWGLKHEISFTSFLHLLRQSVHDAVSTIVTWALRSNGRTFFRTEISTSVPWSFCAMCFSSWWFSKNGDRTQQWTYQLFKL